MIAEVQKKESEFAAFQEAIAHPLVRKSSIAPQLAARVRLIKAWLDLGSEPLLETWISKVTVAHSVHVKHVEETRVQQAEVQRQHQEIAQRLRAGKDSRSRLMNSLLLGLLFAFFAYMNFFVIDSNSYGDKIALAVFSSFLGVALWTLRSRR